jgi:hypothetical protein
MKEKMVYEIGGKKYTQAKLVLGQVQQLIGLLAEVNWPATISAPAILMSLGDKAPDALAILLNPLGVELKEKDLKAMAEDFKYSIDLETGTEVIEDFLSCNQIASLSKKYKAMAANLGFGKSATGSPKSASPSPKGT